MKKFALLGAVAALATAGGVFAAWTFNTTTIEDKTDKISIVVDWSSTTEGVGIVTATGTYALTISTNGNVNANSVNVSIAGSLTLSYEASSAATDKGVDYRISMSAVEVLAEGYDAGFDLSMTTQSGKLDKTTDEETFDATIFTLDAKAGTVDTAEELGKLREAVEAVNWNNIISIELDQAA